MNIIEIEAKDINLNSYPDLNLVMGFFDGVHLGHQQMINKALKEGEVGVMTFDISPSYALGKELKYSQITSLFDKANILSGLGVKYLFILRTTKELLNLSKDEFIEKILLPISPKKIFVGSDYHFGKNAEGTAESLKEKFNVEIFELVTVNGTKISSRTIRQLVSEGDMTTVKSYLGRPYQITGLVVEGKHNGEKIGFPTANLELTYPYVLPKIGVYSGYAKLLGKKFKALISMSTHPTIMELKEPIIEVHILDFNDNLYGKEIEVEFVEYMRGIFKFPSPEYLAEQLAKDVLYIKGHLK